MVSNIELFDNFIIPAWAIGFLEYNDSSGLTDDEIAILTRWQAAELPTGAVLDWDSEVSFYHYNDITLQGADCHKVTIYAPAPFAFRGGAE